MKASFVVGEQIVASHIPASLHHILPRSMRKALRHVKHRKITTTYSDNDADRVVSDWLAVNDPMNEAHYYCTNTVDADFDFTSSAEFADIDDEFADLTKVEAMDEVALWKFCTGYDVL